MRKVLALAVILVLCIGLCSCSSTINANDIEGLYYGEWKYNGATIREVLALSNDYTFIRYMSTNGDLVKSEEGTFYISKTGNIVNTRNPDMSQTEYKYSKDTLENNGHKLIKKYWE